MQQAMLNHSYSQPNMSFAHQTYKQNQIQTCDKSKLIIMLFEGAIRFSKLLKTHMLNGNVSESYYNQTKALQVMAELTNSLNEKDTELGKVLFNLYEYIIVQIAKIQVRDRDTKNLDNLIEILIDLKETIKQAFDITSNR
jgi:flagellar secretion chaperone FliS